jgi:hypothetical protein
MRADDGTGAWLQTRRSCELAALSARSEKTWRRSVEKREPSTAWGVLLLVVRSGHLRDGTSRLAITRGRRAIRRNPVARATVERTRPISPSGRSRPNREPRVARSTTVVPRLIDAPVCGPVCATASRERWHVQGGGPDVEAGTSRWKVVGPPRRRASVKARADGTRAAGHSRGGTDRDRRYAIRRMCCPGRPECVAWVSAARDGDSSARGGDGTRSAPGADHGRVDRHGHRRGRAGADRPGRPRRRAAVPWARSWAAAGGGARGDDGLALCRRGTARDRRRGAPGRAGRRVSGPLCKTVEWSQVGRTELVVVSR